MTKQNFNKESALGFLLGSEITLFSFVPLYNGLAFFITQIIALTGAIFLGYIIGDL